MKSHNTIAGKLYTVTSPSGCTVTDETGLQLGTVEGGEQKTFVATGAQLSVDDDAARVTLTFKRAASALRLLGGGVKSELPAGYLRAEFLESTAGWGNMNQKIKLDGYFDPAKDSFVLETQHSKGLYRGALSLEGNEGHFAYGLTYEGYVVLKINGVTAAEKKLDAPSSDYLWRVESTPSQQTLYLNNEKIKEATQAYSSSGVIPLGLFGTFNGSRVFRGQKRHWTLTVNGKLAAKILPCVAKNGKPCMFDSVNNAPYYNAAGTEQFIVGFTLPQARKLGKHLPAGGGALTISLPTGYEQDAAVAESLETARAKGWTLTIQTYTPETEAAAATFGMRRVWVRRVQDEQGGYVDADGVRWSVDWCVDMLTPDGSTPDAHGYELYRSTEAAVAYWELSAWVDPNAKEHFNVID